MIEVGIPWYEVFYVICHGEFMSQHVIYHDINYVLFHNTFYAYNLNIFVSVCKNIDIIINHIFNDNNINNNIALIFSPAV